MDQKLANAIGAEVRTALAPVAAKHGLTVRLKGGTYDPATGMFRPSIVFEEADTAERTWKRTASSFGLPDDLFGVKFEHANFGTCKIVGIKSAASKMPVLVQGGNDHLYKMRVDAVLKLTGRISTFEAKTVERRSDLLRLRCFYCKQPEGAEHLPTCLTVLEP